MKKITLSILSVVCCALAFSQSPTNVILLLNIGQSNVVGRAEADPLNEVPLMPGTFWYKASTNALQTLQDPVGEGLSLATDRSMSPMLGKKLKELTGQDVIIVPAGVGNTAIEDWMKTTNVHYPRAKKMWEDAIAYCAANNITITHKYIHWLQGENDAGRLETDGYYISLGNLVNDFMRDFGVEKVFGTRIGYDPAYTSSIGSEKIMKAQKIENFNNPNFILASTAPSTFTVANGKMRIEGVINGIGIGNHYSLKGQNEVAVDVANAINEYIANGTKPTLPEPVAALVPVVNGAINLSPNWTFNFANTIDDDNKNVSLQQIDRQDILLQSGLVYNTEGLVLDGSQALRASRPFQAATFTIEMRLKMATSKAWTCLLGPFARGGNYYNKLLINSEDNTNNAYVSFGTDTESFSWPLSGTIVWTNYHTLKITKANNILRLYIDGVQQGADKPSYGSFSFSWIGSGASYDADMRGSIDFLTVKNSVDGVALPLKFKSFKATNIK